MVPRFSVSHFAILLLFFFLFIFSFTATLGNNHEDPTIKAMEDFSGYPIHESHAFSSNTPSSLSVDAQSLQNQIDELSTLSDTLAPSVTRILYTEKDVLARRFIKNLMGLSGLSVREDAVGNIFGRWEGDQPELAAVATGSHIDAIPFSGKYDGVVGVLGAIEAINVLKGSKISQSTLISGVRINFCVLFVQSFLIAQVTNDSSSLLSILCDLDFCRSGFKPKRALEVILFTSEEPTRFGISCLGSCLLAGSEALAKALKTTVDGNITFFDAARSAGYAKDQDDLSSVFLKKGTCSAFVELHIEQGPILEEEGISIGIVTAIAAPASIKVEFEGNGGHVGAVLMPNRNDAGLPAAELALAVERHVLESGSIDSVGTVGIMELHPGAINSMPSKSHLEIDTRDIHEERRNIIIEKIQQSASTIAKKRRVRLSKFKIINQDPPALSEKSINDAMKASSKELNLTHKLMISRAYHDSLFMARVSPMGMIFIPCYKGYSHKPEEFSPIEDISTGVKVLALTLAKLSLK